ncbi:hypothetical protein RHG09_06995 [Clostridioides difficile]|uniref:hypothetical protein n=1 Tax=Clostridioides difficile TaxID=1496 RepID=UPI001034985F|nr:hypothetical protein [Clostridioides difficile]MBY1352389.1 hypothetical protein [Clostridioides difficile]MCJ0276744.1 hypothetical protein [Clostridioides difficile]MCJ0339071.1 hypothetical protein [Clostridioides difficile]MDB3371342.1 hypothetical protein [Clostridioides difficile]MDV9573186.1 hypothetical protein [Clostridioides difficile]
MKDNTYTKKVLEARKKLLLLDKKVQLEILSVYKDASKTILSDIIKNKELNLSTKYLKKLNKLIEKYINELNQRLVPVIEKSITEASNIAKDLQMYYYQSIVPNKSINLACDAMCIKTTTNVVGKIVAGNFYKDKRSLDSRIWGYSNKNRKDIDRLIKANIARGANAKTLAKSLDNYVNPVKKTEAKTLEVGMNKSISYQAQRLARTSITHAFVETSVQNAINNPFCVGLQWNLSSQHYIRQVKWRGEDECDEYAEQNRFGLGEGVFPPEKYPIPHPNCLCYPVQVIIPISEASKMMENWLGGGDDDILDSWYDEIREKNNSAPIIKKQRNKKNKITANSKGDRIKKNITNSIKNKSKKAPKYVQKYINKYVNPNKIIIDNSQKIPFIYYTKVDLVGINPNIREFKSYNKEAALLHEFAHRIDINEIKSYNNIKFQQAIESSSMYVIKNIENLQSIYTNSNELYNNEFISDMLGALSNNEFEDLLATHSEKYWSKNRNKEKEIFANLFTLNYQNNKEINSFIKEHLNSLDKIFNELLGGI